MGLQVPFPAKNDKPNPPIHRKFENNSKRVSDFYGVFQKLTDFYLVFFKEIVYDRIVKLGESTKLDFPTREKGKKLPAVGFSLLRTASERMGAAREKRTG